MEPISNSNRPTSDEPTPAEINAGECLPHEPEPLECRVTDAPAAPPPTAVKSLVDKHPPSLSAAPREPSQASPSAPVASSRPGIALSVGGNIAIGPGIAVAAEGSIGVVVDLNEPKISVFTSAAWGTAVAAGVSAGVSGQLSLVKDVTKFWGSGAELGVNLPGGAVSPGAALNYTTPTPGGPREFSGVTGSLGPGLGGDTHYFEGNTTERWGTSPQAIKDALKRAFDPNDSICVGP